MKLNQPEHLYSMSNFRKLPICGRICRVTVKRFHALAIEARASIERLASRPFGKSLLPAGSVLMIRSDRWPAEFRQQAQL